MAKAGTEKAGRQAVPEVRRGASDAPAAAPPGRRPGWRDGLFLALACAGLAGAAHATGSPEQLVEHLRGGVLAPVAPAVLVELSLPFILGLAALFGPAILRWPWQAGVLALGTGWLGLVGLALLQERAIGQSFDVVSCAAGLAALVALALGLKPRRGARDRSGAGPTEAAPA